MRVVLVIVAELAPVGPVLAWVFVVGPTALLFFVGSAVVCGCAAMPVVFSLVTRQGTNPERKRAGR